MTEMADIVRYPLVRHLRGTETTHIRHVRNGKVLHEGTGGSFWFRPLSAVLSEVPIDDRELPLLFHVQTVDFQDVAVQATITFRLVDPVVAAQRVDFSIDPDSGRWRATPLAQVTSMLSESAQQYAAEVLATTDLSHALTGLAAVRAAIAEGLAGDPRLAETGIAIVGTRVVAIKAEPSVEKALQTPTRELLQQDADKATYERRAVAVERERAIAENELQNQIELAKREQQLVAQRGINSRRSAEEQAAADEIRTTAEAARTQRLDATRAQGIEVVGAAEASAELARLAAYRDVPEAVLMALAVKELAGNLPAIESLVLTPDLLAPVLARLGTRAGAEQR